jgi:hypothetical protein
MEEWLKTHVYLATWSSLVIAFVAFFLGRLSKSSNPVKTSADNSNMSLAIMVIGIMGSVVALAYILINHKQ